MASPATLQIDENSGSPAEGGRRALAAMMREWDIARGHKFHLEAVKDVLRGLPQ
jgi:hypothetical protein